MLKKGREVVERGTVLVLGSGATRGGQFKVHIDERSLTPPLDNDFFESEAVKAVLCTRSYPALSYYKRGHRLESNWANIDLRLKLCLGRVITEEDAWENCKNDMMDKSKEDSAYKEKMENESCESRVPSMAEWELRRSVREVYHDLRSPEPTEESPLYKLVTALCDETLLRGIISFNYDTSVEELLHNKFYYPVLQDISTNDKLPLVKLHGSLNWQESPELKPEITCVDDIAEMNYRNGQWKQPSVIGPTFFKQEITIDFQQDYRAKFYRQLWRFAWNMLRTAQNLLFVGFSFPKTDFHAKALFGSAHSPSGRFGRVILCHKDGAQLRKTVKKVFEGESTYINEFNDGLEDVATQHLEEVVELLR